MIIEFCEGTDYKEIRQIFDLLIHLDYNIYCLGFVNGARFRCVKK